MADQPVGMQFIGLPEMDTNTHMHTDINSLARTHTENSSIIPKSLL